MLFSKNRSFYSIICVKPTLFIKKQLFTQKKQLEKKFTFELFIEDSEHKISLFL